MPVGEDLAEPNLHSVTLPSIGTQIKISRPELDRVIIPDISTRVQISRTYRVEVKTEVSVHDRSELGELLRKVARESRVLWNMAIVGELYESTIKSEDTEDGNSHQGKVGEKLAAQFLYSWWYNEHGDSPEAALSQWSDYPTMQLPLNTDTQCFIKSVVRLAALISCGMGVGAFEWSKPNLMPVLVEFRDRWFLALTPHMAVQPESRCDFWLAAALTPWSKGWILLARHPGSEPHYTPCLFPWDVDIVTN